MLDEVCDTLGWERKHAIKALNNQVSLGKQAGRRGSKVTHSEADPVAFASKKLCRSG